MATEVALSLPTPALIPAAIAFLSTSASNDAPNSHLFVKVRNLAT